MKIEVIKTTKAASCPMGLFVKEYESGNTYEMHQDLADTFIKQGWGKEVVKEVKAESKIESKPEIVVEEKALPTKLENKAIEVIEENKKLEETEVRAKKHKKKRRR